MYDHLLAPEKRCDLHPPLDSMDNGETRLRSQYATRFIPPLKEQTMKLFNWIKSLFKPPEIIEYKPTERDTEFKQYIEMLGGSPFAANLQIPYPSDELNENFKDLREKIENTDFDQDRKVILSRENYDILKDHEYCQFQVIAGSTCQDESYQSLYNPINCLGNVTEFKEQA